MHTRGVAPRYILPPFQGWFMSVEKHDEIKRQKIFNRN
jgi:hypothetical protein